MCETLTYPQTLALTDRLDYLSAHMNRHALCMCIEEAMGLEIPERAKYIRTIMDELTRIASHLLFWSTFCMDLGALTAFFYGFRDREKILDMFEETCGGRLIQNYNCIGGVMADIHPNLITRIKDFIRYLPPMLKEYRPAADERHRYSFSGRCYFLWSNRSFRTCLRLEMRYP